MLTAEEVRLRRQKRRRLIIAIASAITVVCVATIAARPVRNAIKGWQSRRHAEQAFALIEQMNWKAARTEAVAAYQLRPDEPQALRAIARLLSRMRQPDGLQFWHQLEEKSPLTRTDLRDEAAVALVSGETRTADLAVQRILHHADGPPSPGDWLLAAQLAVQKNSPADAQSALEKILADPAATEPEQFQAVLLQFALLSGEEADQRAAHQATAIARLKKIAAGQTSTALDALTLIARQTLARTENTAEPPIMTTPDLVAAIERHPLAKTHHKLLALDLQMHDDASQRENLIARAISEWKDAEPADVAVLAEWLNGKGEFQRQLDTIPLDRALQNRDLFLQHLDALGALGRWTEIKELIEGERFPLDQVVAAMYLARCNTQLGEIKAAENNWQRALEAARGDVSKILSLAAYAEKNGATTAEAAYEEAALEAPKLRVAQQGRLRMAQGGGDTRRIHAVLADMLKYWPNDSAVQNDEAYLRLLLMQPQNAEVGTRNAAPTPNSNLPSPSSNLPTSAGAVADEAAAIEKVAAKLVELEPASLPHRTLLALALLREGRGEDALHVYDHLNVTPQVLTPSALAVHAAVLAATHHDDDATTEAGQVPRDKLLPEERALLPQ